MILTAIGLAAAGVLWNADRSVEHLRLAAAALCFCIATLLLLIGDPERATVLALVIVAAIHGASALKYAHSGLKLTVTDLPLLLAGTVPFFFVQYPLAVTAALTCTTTQVGIDVLVGWTRATKPDRFTIWRDGEIIATVEADDVEVSSGVYEWTDTSANPNVANEYKVRAVTGTGSLRAQSVFSPPSSITPVVEGGWIRTDDGDVPLRSGGPYVGITAKQVTKRQTFTLPYAGADVDIVTAVGGLEGEINCWIDAETSVDLAVDVAILEALRRAMGLPTGM